MPFAWCFMLNSPTDTPRPGLQRRRLGVWEAGATRSIAQGRQSSGGPPPGMVSWMVVQRENTAPSLRGLQSQRTACGGDREPRCPPGRPLLRSAGDSGRAGRSQSGAQPPEGPRAEAFRCWLWAVGQRALLWGRRVDVVRELQRRRPRPPWSFCQMITRGLRGLGGWPPVTRAGPRVLCSLQTPLPFCPSGV